MKYITGIAIVVTAVLGCSYVGSASASSCEDIGKVVTEANIHAMDMSATRAVAPEAYDSIKKSAVSSCRIGVRVRNDGVSPREASLIMSALIVSKASGATTEPGVATFGITNAAFSLGYAYGDK